MTIDSSIIPRSRTPLVRLGREHTAWEQIAWRNREATAGGSVGHDSYAVQVFEDGNAFQPRHRSQVSQILLVRITTRSFDFSDDHIGDDLTARIDWSSTSSGIGG